MSTDVPHNPDPRPHLPALDGVRGLAILAVLAFHLTRPMPSQLPEAMAPLRAVTSVGWMGVDLFFVLSGLLITGILWDARNAPHRFRNFYARRTLRIFPIYYLAVLGLAGWVAYQHVRGVDVGDAPPSLAMLATYTLNFGLAAQGWPAAKFAGIDAVHFWSLAIEEQFYLVWPAVVFGIGRRRALIGLCLAIIIACPLARTVLHLHGVSFDVLFNLTPLRIDALAVGAIIALLLRGESAPRRWSIIETAGLLGLISLCAFAVHYGRLTETKPLLITIGLTCVALVAGALVRQAVIGRLVPRLLSARPLVVIGKYSYGLYLYHWFVFQIVRAQFPAERMSVARYALFVAMSLAISGAVAWISFRVIETPFLRLKRYFAETPNNPENKVSR